MTDIKLKQLPDRTPVKLAIMLAPNLKNLLDEYLILYRATYADEDASLADIIPPMLDVFIASDRAFLKARKDARTNP